MLFNQAAVSKALQNGRVLRLSHLGSDHVKSKEIEISNNKLRHYAQKKKKLEVKYPDDNKFVITELYKPTVPDRHTDDKAAMMAEEDVMEEDKKLAGKILTIEEVRRKAGSKRNVERVIEQLVIENEDPLIRQAYEELEDEDRIRRGLPPLKRPPPGKLQLQDWRRKKLADEFKRKQAEKQQRALDGIEEEEEEEEEEDLPRFKHPNNKKMKRRK